MKKQYDISVVVVAYNSHIDRLLKTLDSIISQENIRVQIIITDDGSTNNWFPEVSEYFKEKDFSDYKLISSDINTGTVKNLYRGILASDAAVIKGVSPDDFFCEKDTLSKWLDFYKRKKCRWSFSECICYTYENDMYKIKEINACPQDLRPYLKNNLKKTIWNYIIYQDWIFGCNMLADKDIYLEYLEKILDKVIYAEDNIFRMMLYDGIMGAYYPHTCMMYEVGSGVSTSANSVWLKRLQQDAFVTDEIIFAGKKQKGYRRFIRTIYYKPNKLTEFIVKGMKYIHCRLKKNKSRMTAKEIF